jgi:hypothetical protein
MKNKLSDLNNHLFETLERLNDDKIKGDVLRDEIERAKAIAGIGGQIVGAAKVTLDAIKLVAAGHIRKEDMPLMLKEK